MSTVATIYLKPNKRQSCHHIETSPLIWRENQLTGFYLKTTLVLHELICITAGSWSIGSFSWLSNTCIRVSQRSVKILFQEAATGNVLWKRCSRKFRKIDRRTPLPVSFSIKFIQKDSGTGVFLWIFWVFYKHLFKTTNPGDFYFPRFSIIF